MIRWSLSFKTVSRSPLPMVRGSFALVCMDSLNIFEAFSHHHSRSQPANESVQTTSTRRRIFLIKLIRNQRKPHHFCPPHRQLRALSTATIINFSRTKFSRGGPRSETITILRISFWNNLMTIRWLSTATPLLSNAVATNKSRFPCQRGAKMSN